MKQKARLAQEQAAQEGTYRGKTSPRRRISKRGKRVIAAAVVVAAVCLVFLYMEKRSYHSYKVLNTSEQEDVVSTQYVEMDGDILRYSPDGVSVVDNSMNTIWNETYTMQNPIADVNGSRAVVADREGTELYASCAHDVRCYGCEHPPHVHADTPYHGHDSHALYPEAHQNRRHRSRILPPG